MTTYSIASTDRIWQGWVATTATASAESGICQAWTSITTATTVWRIWTTTTYVPAIQPCHTLSPEELERSTRESGRRLDEERALREAAERRAKALLLECLSLEQRLAYEKTRKFRVEAPSGRVYELRHGWAGNVEEVADGKPVRRFCIHPSEYVPVPDNLLAQKLLLETDEEQFLRTANATELN